MVKKVLEGFLFGLGFMVAVAIVWSIFTQVVIRAVYSDFETSPARSVEGRPVEVMPTKSAAATEERNFELHKGPRPGMEIPPGGGLLSLAIIDAPKGSDRPSTIQAWVTETEAFLIETSGEVPKVKKVPYPATGAEDLASDLVHEYAGFRKGNLTTTVSASEVRRIKNGIASDHSDMNGLLRITSEDVVFFVPNKFDD